MDGRECQGCFRQAVERLDYNEKLICWIEIPKCQCTQCRVFCGSQINPDNGSLYEVTHQGVTTDAECVKWYVKKLCDNCG